MDISTNQIANGLLSQSLQSGDKVAILLNNCTEFLQIFIGVSKAGLTPVPLDSKWSAKEIQSIQRECRFSMIFTEECHLHKVWKESDSQIICVNPKEKKDAFHQWLHQFSKKESTVPDVNPILFIGFTSGTTGLPKGFIRSQISGYISIIVPLLLTSIQHTENLSLAIEARAYGDGSERTKYKTLHYTKLDYQTILFTFCIFASFVVLKYWSDFY